jgi:hypothetical protein
MRSEDRDARDFALWISDDAGVLIRVTARTDCGDVEVPAVGMRRRGGWSPKLLW